MEAKIGRKKVIWKLENFTRETIEEHKRIVINAFGVGEFSMKVNGKNSTWGFSIMYEREEDVGIFVDYKRELDGLILIRIKAKVFIQAMDKTIKELSDQDDYYLKENWDFEPDTYQPYDTTLFNDDNLLKVYGRKFYKGLASNVYFKLHEIEDQERKFVDSTGTATFIIDLEVEDIEDEFRRKMRRIQEESSDQKAMLRYFNSDIFSDFTIVCSDGLEIPAHRNIIATHSAVFDAMLQSEMLENKDRKLTIDDIDGDVMLEVLRHIYGGIVQNLDVLVVPLIYAAEKYSLIALKSLCVSHLIYQISSFNVLQLLFIADKFNAKDLEAECLDFIKINFNELSVRSMCDLQNNEDWKHLGYKVILKILKSSKEFSVKDVPILVDKVDPSNA